MTTSVSTTGSISSAGIGSGLDVNSIVSQLVAAERSSTDTQISNQTSAVNSKVGAYSSIKQALTNLQNATQALQGVNSAFNSFSASSSDNSVFTATASTSATAGTYDIEVDSLATAQKLASSGFSSTASAIGTGALTLSVGGKAFTVNVDSTNNTPSQLVNAINNASDNTGLTASLITADDGTHIVFQSNTTGADNAITITASGGDGGLNALAYDPANSNTQLTQLTKATSASVSIDGYTYTSDSNQFSDAIPGVTINLASAESGTTLQLNVASNTSGIDSAMQAFVSAYNAVASVIGNATAYDSSTSTASALTGDSLATQALSQLRSAMMSTTPGTTGGVRSLFDLGITTNQDGTLTLDNDKLNTALASNSQSASNLFSTSGALGTSLGNMFTGYLSAGGLFDSRNTALQSQLTDLSKQEDTLNTRMTDLTALYTKQYNALDTLMSQMSSTSAFLTNEFDSTSSKSSS